MPHEHAPQIEATFSRVMEQMAFLFADPIDPAEVIEPPAEPISARMTFSGAACGSLSLHTQRSVCAELLENITGDPVASRQLEEQALLELLNVICGQMLTDIAGAEPVFDLTPPQILSEDAPCWEAICQAPDTLAFTADEHAFLLQIDYR